VNKAQLIDKLSTQLGSKKAATDAVDAVVDTITRAVASGERVAITGFGVFEKVARPARVGRNPRTGAAVKIKKTTVPKFKAGQGFKDVVSGAKKLPKAAVSVARAATGTSAPAKKTTAKKTTAKKTAARKSTSKSAAGRTLATKSPAKSAAAKKTAAKKLAKKSPAKKATARKR
jgi:DNA-binding protein HU-beta